MCTCLILAIVIAFLLGMFSADFANLGFEDGLQKYLDTHPPLTDEQYLALCSPDVDPEICLKVRVIVSDALGIEEAMIYPEARFVEDLGGC